MAESNSPRLGLRRWTADTDTWARSEFDDNNAAREALVAAFAQGGATRPSPTMGGRFYYDDTTDAVSYDGGTRWVTVQRQEQAVLSYPYPSGAFPDNDPDTGSNTAPGVFRRGDLVTLILALRPSSSSGYAANEPLVIVPSGFRPPRPVPVELFSRPGRFYGRATLAINGWLTSSRAFSAAERLYGTVTYPAP